MPGKQSTDITGERFGKWLVVGFSYRALNGQSYWTCRCDCGTQSDVRGSALKRGKSAGCLHCNTSRVTHGHTRGRKLPPEYHLWASMRERCADPFNKSFADYGGRGISVCDRWQGPDGFANFLADMGDRPKGTSLDRINNDGNYEPSNCRWATRKEQNRNTRRNRLVTCNGKTQCVAD